MSTSGSLEPTVLSRIMRTYLQLFFEIMIFRNSIRNGTKFYYPGRKSHLMKSWKGLYKLRIRVSEKLKTVLELYNMENHQKKAGPDHHRLKTMVKRSIEQNLRIKNAEARKGNCKRNAVVKNQGQNSVNKEVNQIVGSGKPTGSVLKETIAVSVTISISVQKIHSRILLRALLRSRMKEKRREPEVPEAEVPVVECLDGLARITSEELAITHFVKNGTLQNVCSTRPRVVAGLGRRAHLHIVRLTHSRRNGPNRIMTTTNSDTKYTNTNDMNKHDARDLHK